MGLFRRRREEAPDTCEMCGKTEADGCGSKRKHVMEVRGDDPPWLPAHLRVQARGEYTFLCSLCNSYPASKWPRAGGAEAGMLMHLGGTHQVGSFSRPGLAVPIDMISASG